MSSTAFWVSVFLVPFVFTPLYLLFGIFLSPNTFKFFSSFTFLQKIKIFNIHSALFHPFCSLFAHIEIRFGKQFKYAARATRRRTIFTKSEVDANRNKKPATWNATKKSSCRMSNKLIRRKKHQTGKMERMSFFEESEQLAFCFVCFCQKTKRVKIWRKTEIGWMSGCLWL